MDLFWRKKTSSSVGRGNSWEPGNLVTHRFRMANLTDIQLVEKARSEAQSLFEIDPELSDTDIKPSTTEGTIILVTRKSRY